jgi:4'-phosphopantetheinyl transferase
VLGQILNLHPTFINIQRPLRGCPILDPFQLHFNLSHSGDYGLIGVRFDKPIGVDIEKVIPTFDYKSVMQSFYHSEQRTIIESESPLDMFYQFWVAKEALLKARGTGFMNDRVPEVQFIDQEFVSEGNVIQILDSISNYKIAIV